MGMTARQSDKEWKILDERRGGISSTGVIHAAHLASQGLTNVAYSNSDIATISAQRSTLSDEPLGAFSRSRGDNIGSLRHDSLRFMYNYI